MNRLPPEPGLSGDAAAQRLRVLIVSPFPPRLDGADGGARTIAQLAAELSGRARVALLCLRGPGEAPVDDGLRARVERVEEVPRPAFRSPPARALRFVRWRAALAVGRPLWASDLRRREYARRLTALAADFRPDVVQVEHPAMAQYLPALAASAAVRVLVEHDPQAGARGDTRVGRLDAWAWRGLRRRALRAVDAAVVFTERDREALAGLAGQTPVVRIPLGTDFAQREFAADRGDGSLLFVGNFVHAPNVDAARRLVTSIHPAVRARRPDCVLHVVGEGPPNDLAGPGVAVAGRVPSVAPYLERASVVVAPLRTGGGMRVKVLEALAAGKAVVASPLAVEGLDVRDGRELALATTDEEFAARVVELLEDAPAREALGARARAWAREHLTWDAPVREYERLYARLLEARRG